MARTRLIPLVSRLPWKNDPPIPEDLAPISGRKEADLLRERRPYLEQRLIAEQEELFPDRSVCGWGDPQNASDPELEQWENVPARKPRRDRRQGQPFRPERFHGEGPAQEGRPATEAGALSNRNRKGPRPGDRDRAERIEKLELPEKSFQPSRQQRRRQQQGKAEPRGAQMTPPEKSPAPEKTAADHHSPKPESKKNNKRRYYHNRKPNG